MAIGNTSNAVKYAIVGTCTGALALGKGVILAGVAMSLLFEHLD